MTWNSGHVITPWLRLSWLPQRLWKVTQEAARRLCFLQVYSDNNDHLEQLCIDFHHWSPFPVKWPKGWQQNAPPAHILIILYHLDFFTLCLYKKIFFYPGMKSKLKNNIVPVAGHNHARMWCSITCPAGAPPPDVSPSLSSPSYRQSSPAAVNKVSLFCPGCLAGWKPRTSPLCLWGGSIRNFWGINFAFRWAVIFPAWQHVL